MTEDTCNRLPWRVKTLPDPNPRYAEFLRRLETPEMQDVFQIPSDRKHLLPDRYIQPTE